MPVPSTPPGVVVLYSDIGCPWASLAVHRLLRRRRELGLDGRVVLDHRAFPLELFNDRPTPKTIVDAEVAIVGSHEPSLDWQPWQLPERDHPGSTLLPLQAVQAAKADAVGGLAASEQLDAALRHAWYADSRPIQVWSVIRDVAAGCDAVDLDAFERQVRAGGGQDDVFAQWSLAGDHGVQGSPHLFTTDGWGVHNPGITLGWTREQFSGLPVIEADDPGVVDEVLARAGRLPAR